MTQKITIIGAGAWGTAIANLLAQNNHEVCAISDLNEIAQEINQKNTHPALNGIKLSPNLTSSTNLEQHSSASDLIYVVTPSTVVSKIIDQLTKIELKPNCGFVICTKGLDHDSLKFFHQIIEEKLPNHPIAVLAGPNFAIEVAQGNPTITNIASKDKNFADSVIKAMQNDYFKPIYLDNVLIAEISSIVKNIMAISCGISDELDLGENCKAALVVQGLSEIHTLAKALGDQNPNTENAASFGDIFLTCATTKSRNNTLGHLLGQGQKYSDLKKTKTFEGALNADSVNRLAQKLGVELKLCQTIYEILENQPSIDEIKQKIVNIIC